MCQIAVTIPDGVLYDSKMNKDEAGVFARKAVALAYYQKNKISLGYCAEIAGMTEADFIRFLGENGISIFHFDSMQEFDEELANA